MKKLAPGTVLDGFVIDELLHAGGMAYIYTVHYENGTTPGFDLAMKVPQMSKSDGGENIVSYEVEQQIMSMLKGTSVPRFVAAGDLERVPYLVMEYVHGKPLEDWVDNNTTRSAQELAKIGVAVAKAVHSLHQQEVVHQDLKPANVLMRPDGTALLLDFGLSSHAHLPDLLAEQMRKAVGSPIYMAPEQVVGVRGDPRSDIFAIGVMLYELATGEFPFGAASTQGGLRQRLWMDPVPPRKLRPDLPEWFQEVVLHCLEIEADKRYPSAAHLAFDLANPDQVKITARGRKTQGTTFSVHFKRWLKAAGKHYHASPLPTQQIAEVPIVMVALPHWDVSDATYYALRQATARSLGLRPGARLAVVSVVAGNLDAHLENQSDTHIQRHLLTKMQQWAMPLQLEDHHCSFHVLEGGDVADILLKYAGANDVDLIIMGAATHGLKRQSMHIVPTIPIKVAMESPCSVLLVKQELPFAHLGATQ